MEDEMEPGLIKGFGGLSTVWRPFWVPHMGYMFMGTQKGTMIFTTRATMPQPYDPIVLGIVPTSGGLVQLSQNGVPGCPQGPRHLRGVYGNYIVVALPENIGIMLTW